MLACTSLVLRLEINAVPELIVFTEIELIVACPIHAIAVLIEFVLIEFTVIFSGKLDGTFVRNDPSPINLA